MSWDCQFFIYATEPMPVGKEVRLTMYVKGDKAGSIETQAHWGPGDYNHYQLFGNVSVTTEWQKVVLEATVGSDHVKASDGKAFQSVAFNLSTDKAGNVFYFDDVKLQMRDPKTDDGSDAGAWINFMRKGIYSDDYIGETEYGTKTDENGNDVEGGTVEYVIDFNSKSGSGLGAYILGASVSGGEATENVDLSAAPGKYDAKVSYTGNEKYEDAEVSDVAEILALNTTTECNTAVILVDIIFIITVNCGIDEFYAFTIYTYSKVRIISPCLTSTYKIHSSFT